MLSEHAVIFYSYDVISVIWVIVSQMKKNLELNTCLMLEFALVPYDLDCHDLAGLVVDALQSLTK